MSELRPCPFCGSKTVTHESKYGGGNWLECENRECIGSSIVGVFSQWQSRPIEDALRNELELARKIQDEAIKQTEILTKELNVWKPASITAQLELATLRKQLDIAVVQLTAIRAVARDDVLPPTPNYLAELADYALAEINRLGGKNV